MAAPCRPVQATDYVSGVRANLLLGGDNCSRAVLVGALLAAQGGAAGDVPADWAAKTQAYAQLEAAAIGLLAHRYDTRRLQRPMYVAVYLPCMLRGPKLNHGRREPSRT